jgi:spermidine synthase
MAVRAEARTHEGIYGILGTILSRLCYNKKMIACMMIRGFCLFLMMEALNLPGPCQEGQVVYEVASRYQRITVLDTASGARQLIFDGTDSIQSEMNLDNHEELMLSYARHMMTGLPVPAKIKRILILGLGGACMQRYLYKLLPEVIIETVELDPEVRNIAARFFYFAEDARQIVHLGDGRTFIENSKAKYDVIFLDAFSATSIPYHLATQQFLKSVKDRVAEGGVVCANLWDGEADYPNMVKTYAAVYPELHVVKCSFSGNSILLALPLRIDLTMARWMDMAAAFEKMHPTGLGLAQLVSRGAAEQVSIPAGAKILLDKGK